MTYTRYTGQRGDDYWETESYTDSQGKRQTRQVRKNPLALRFGRGAEFLPGHIDLCLARRA